MNIKAPGTNRLRAMTSCNITRMNFYIYKNIQGAPYIFCMTNNLKIKIRIKSTNRQYQSNSHPMCNNRL